MEMIQQINQQSLAVERQNASPHAVGVLVYLASGLNLDQAPRPSDSCESKSSRWEYRQRGSARDGPTSTPGTGVWDGDDPAGATYWVAADSSPLR